MLIGKYLWQGHVAKQICVFPDIVVTSVSRSVVSDSL